MPALGALYSISSAFFPSFDARISFTNFPPEAAGFSATVTSPISLQSSASIAVIFLLSTFSIVRLSTASAALVASRSMMLIPLSRNTSVVTVPQLLQP